MRISATDVDEGENAQITYDLHSANNVAEDIEYFEWDQAGVVKLRRRIDKPISHNFLFKATATDAGSPPKSTTVDVTIEVKESSNKAPSFVDGPGSEIPLVEGYNDFSKPIASYVASSNIPGDNTVFFQLVRGRTEQTNKHDTFRAIQSASDPNKVDIYLTKPLQYETVNKYMLTLQVRNTPDLVAEAILEVKVIDQNNLAPVFTNVESGRVLENEPPGTIVMQVNAIDKDGTFPNSKVSYRISNRNKPEVRNKFSIDQQTGVVRTNVEFDREETEFYALIIEAVDGAASTLTQDGRENITPQTFRIVIADVNDNPPTFKHTLYRAEVPEDQDVNSKVIEVKADDLDDDSTITTYQIVSGNVGNAFTIEEQTGYIRVAKPLDYETIKEYNLMVGAWDGSFSSQTHVEIKVLNVNDMKPQFQKKKYEITLKEEEKPAYPIIRVSAIDPDIGDTTKEQNMTYYLDPRGSTSKYFSIDEKSGDVRIVEPLDRDLPNGLPRWTLYIFARDQNGKGLESFVELVITLDDVNDNAPYLDMPDGLVWYENQNQGEIGVLQADDYDTEENAGPFTFKLDGNADHDMKQWFEVTQINNGSYVIRALTSFDREKRKYYSVPINICDVKNACAVSYLTVIIGDRNDNPMQDGASEIFVYNYEGKAPDTQIGRVYVKDPDDWDLPDKTFKFVDPSRWPGFRLDSNTGTITMKRGIRLPDEINNFMIDFKVEDPVHGQIGSKAVSANVNITIQKIFKEAVIKSGSMRIAGTPEEFVKPDGNGVSKRDKFKNLMQSYLNATHFDVFAVLGVEDSKSKKVTMTDIRFSAHGSPYYKPERMEGALAKRRNDVSQNLRIDIVMIKVDECMYENVNCEGGSCSNRLEISDRPVSIYTNTSSFVGVNARIVPDCQCLAPNPKPGLSCEPNPCYNGGECSVTNTGYKCECPIAGPGTFGPNCERLAGNKIFYLNP